MNIHVWITAYTWDLDEHGKLRAPDDTQPPPIQVWVRKPPANEHNVLIGEGTLQWEQHEKVNIVEQQIAGLRNKADALAEQYHRERQQIEDRISSLLAIEYTAPSTGRTSSPAATDDDTFF